MKGASVNTLYCPDMAEVVGPAMLGMRNSTNKVGILLGGRPDKGITPTQFADTVGAALGTTRKQI